jgi:putative chitinase
MSALFQPFQLSAVAGCNIATATVWTDVLSTAMGQRAIVTPKRIAAFIAQVAHESLGFFLTEENLAYRAKRLLEIFPGHFDETSAAQYAGKPKAIASRVYANRMGNHDEASGDGWVYRGRGLIQLTGRENYQLCGKALGVDLERNPDWLLGKPLAAQSAAWFWLSHGCNEFADFCKIDAISRRINGGNNGLAERRALYEKALKVFR